MPKFKLWLITGVPGARMDFVSGWLSCLPGWLDIRWRMDLNTGRSFGDYHTKPLDWGQNLTDLLQQHKIELSAAGHNWASSCHGHSLESVNIESYLSNGSLKIFYIDIDAIDQQKLVWEFVIKTFCSPNRRLADYLNNTAWRNLNQAIMENPTMPDNVDQLEFKEQLHLIIRHFAEFPPDMSTTINKDLPHQSLSYNQLFVPGGSEYLCNTMNISAAPRYHDFWNSMLEFADTPDEVEIQGHVFRRADYFN